MTSGSVSCREVTQAHLAQIERVNPVLNALVEAADPEECLRQADHADECAARGEPLGAAHGLPVVVKDVMKVAGLACSGGSRTLRAVATPTRPRWQGCGRGRHRARTRVPARGCR